MNDAGDKTIADVTAGGVSDVSVAPGGPTVLASRYELLGLLGSGGMGTVYRARDRELDEIVALKVLKKELAQAPGMLERFRREVKLARKVTHVNVARTFDIGEDGGDRFLTMELVEGEPLSAFATRGRLPIGRALAIAREVLAGLAASHDAGVVHGDLKPENVICARNGRVVITDFGIARALSVDPDAERTSTGMLVGTPQYMAPEQVEGASDLDGRADIYALGCMLFRLITGQPAFRGSSYVMIAAARLLHEPPDPTELNPELSPAVRDFVRACMARSRDDRFADARAASDTLAHVLEELDEVAAPATTIEASLVRATELEGRGPPRATRTVAVLPIHNQGAADDAYLAAGLTDDLIDILSGVSQVRVRPRGAVAPFARADRDAREAGRSLAVDAVVDGSLRRAGDRLRVTLRLVTVADGFQLWAKRFERPASGLFAVGDEAAAELAQVLASEKLSAARDAPTDAAALDLYLRGRYIFTHSYFDVAEAVALLRTAHERAPGDGRIAAAYALALVRHHYIALLPASVAEQARTVATRALEIDPTNAEAHVAIALVHLAQSEPRSAAVELGRALELAPHSIDALCWLGNVLLECDRIDDGVTVYLRALTHDAELRVAHANIARAHALRGDWEACDHSLDRLALRGPEDLFHWMVRTRFAVWRGDPEHCDRLLRRVEKATLTPPMLRRLTSMLYVARNGVLPGHGREVLHNEFSLATAARRTAFNAQIRLEIFGRAGLVDDARAEYARLEEAAFFDIAWLDRCPAIACVRGTAEHVTLRKAAVARADRVLDALDNASGLRAREREPE